MRITGINFLQKTNYKNNQYDYSQYRTVLNQPAARDTFTFSNKVSHPSFVGKQEQISRDPLTKLYSEHLNCLCCGREMIDPKVITQLDEIGVFRGSANDAIQILQQYEANMHTVEQSVFKILKKEAELNPDKNIKQIIVDLKNTHEKPLRQKQLGIFKMIDRAALKIKPELHKEIRNYLIKSAETIKEGNNSFSRKRFINDIEEILKNYPNTTNKENLIRLAGKLPTAYDDADAFIVKYANPRYKSDAIAIRLLSYSMATIEHIHPLDSKDIKGPNHLYNYVPECKRCNSFRSNNPMIYQLEEYPEMFINAQNLFDRLIGFANAGKLSKMYIIKLYKALYQESEGMLDLDYSKLQMTNDLQKELKKPYEYPVNPDKPNIIKVKPPTFPKPVNFFEKPEQQPTEILPEQMYNRPLISKRKQKRITANEANKTTRLKPASTKTKKSKGQKKTTIKKSHTKK